MDQQNVNKNFSRRRLYRPPVVQGDMIIIQFIVNEVVLFVSAKNNFDSVWASETIIRFD